MRNYVQPGEVIDYANGATARSAGDLIVINDRVGVASTDIAANEIGSVAMVGVFELKTGTLRAAVKQGQTLYADGSGGVDDTSTTNAVAGYAFEAAAKAATSVLVKINA